jgi:diacylglycerol kinase (ATP)
LKNFQNIHGIIGIGGDGTLFELVNGLLSRPDKKRIPLGILPGGTGNNFVLTFFKESKTDAISIMKQWIENNFKKISKVDVTKVTNDKKEILYSTQMMGWGIAADSTSQAEKYRFLGPARYTVAAIIEILFPSVQHHATVTFDGTVLKDVQALVMGCNSKHVGNDLLACPKADLSDGLLDVNICYPHPGKMGMLKFLGDLKDGSHLAMETTKYVQVKNIKIEDVQETHFTLDGEMLKAKSMEFEVLKQEVEFLK